MSRDIYLGPVEYYLPKKKITNDDISSLNSNWNNSSIENKIGISNRNVLEKNSSSLDSAINAVNLFFKKNKCVNEKKIDAILFCSQTPPILIPPCSFIIQSQFNFKKDFICLDYNLGCSGYPFGLFLAKSIMISNSLNNLLLVTSDAYSKRIDSNDYNNLSLFGDSATCSLITSEKENSFCLMKLGNNYNYSDGLNSLALYHNEKKLDLSNYYNPETFINSSIFHMDGKRVFKFTLDELPGAINKTLLANNIKSINEIDLFIFHQPNTYMLKSIAKKCKIPAEKVVIDIKDYGNTVSSSIPIVISNLSDIKRKSKVLVIGFGVGLSISGIILSN